MIIYCRTCHLDPAGIPEGQWSLQTAPLTAIELAEIYQATHDILYAARCKVTGVRPAWDKLWRVSQYIDRQSAEVQL
jgi:hypothetical protein